MKRDPAYSDEVPLETEQDWQAQASERVRTEEGWPLEICSSCQVLETSADLDECVGCGALYCADCLVETVNGSFCPSCIGSVP